jgi:ATP adenylyltransferase/5',5'''-P-1,P-4-tetraphosphate phosphorylase II
VIVAAACLASLLAEYLFTAYHFLMEAMGIADKELLLSSPSAPLEASYNLLLTARCMLLIPRSRGHYRGMVDVNGLGTATPLCLHSPEPGFYGLLLFRNESTLSRIRCPLPSLSLSHLP